MFLMKATGSRMMLSAMNPATLPMLERRIATGRSPARTRRSASTATTTTAVAMKGGRNRG